MHFRRRCFSFCLVLLAIAVGACRSRVETGAVLAPPARWNVVLVLIDTLRADHLGAYGYGRDTSPVFDALAAESVLFEQARSQAGCTFPSVNSMFTSRWPQAFLMRSRAESARLGVPGSGMGIADTTPTLAEALRAEGYRTAAFSASPIVRATPSAHNREGGFGGGFDEFDESCLWQEAGCVVGKANEWLARRDAKASSDSSGPSTPFFLYLHLMDPHGPYRAPERRFARDYDGAHEFIGRGDPKPIDDRIFKGSQGVSDIPASDIAHLVDRYDDEIAWVDGWLGKWIDALRRSGEWDRTLFVVASDHGEEFLEHGSMRHCHTVWDTETRVPLLARWPGVAARRVATPVGNVDIAPSILARLGLPAWSDAVGRAVFDLSEPSPGSGDLPVFSIQAQFLAITSGDRKLVEDLRSPRAQLFDLANDPGERRDLAASEPDRARELRRRLRDWARDAAAGSAEDGLRAAEEAESALRALGYL